MCQESNQQECDEKNERHEGFPPRSDHLVAVDHVVRAVFVFRSEKVAPIFLFKKRE